MDSNEVQIDEPIVAAKKPQGTWRGLNSIKKKERGKKVQVWISNSLKLEECKAWSWTSDQ